MNGKTLEILICGNIKLFTKEAIFLLTEECKVVLAGQTDLGRQKNLSVYETKPGEEKFRQLFDVYSFRAVYYVSGYADGGEGMYGEIQQLEQVMEACEKSQVDKLVVFSTIDSRNYLLRDPEDDRFSNREYGTGRSFLAAQMEEMCTYFMKKSKVCTVVLQLPYLTDDLNDCNFLGKIFHRIYEGKKLVFPYQRETPVNFLTLMDLTELMLQISEKEDDESRVYCVTSGYSYTYGDLENILKRLSPDLEIRYEKFPYYTEIPGYSRELRRQYGFVPKENVMEDVGVCYQLFLREIVQEKGGFLSCVHRLLAKAGDGVFRYVELILFFLVAEGISHFTSEDVYFRFVDVRLFFIVMMGTIHGMRMGLLAAFLECLALVRGYLQMGMNGTALFYNIGNWIPFAIYFMAGSITGYVSNKKEDALRYLRQEYALLRDKYRFLDQVYHGAIQNKEEYKKQILGFKDSFGKIFDAVQKLDSELPDRIFFEGLKVLEDILENHEIAIYTLDSWQRYGRLAVCSNNLLTRLTKSIRIEDYKSLYEAVNRGQVWKNTEMIPGMPMYVCGIFRGDSMVLLVTIQEVSLDQYGMHYMNIFKILCGLVQTAFLRAVEYEELARERNFYPGTNLVYPERLRQILRVQSAMKEEGVADYVLLRFEDRDKVRVNEQLAGMIRASDVIGMDEKGNIYLLLVQMNAANLAVVGERLQSKGMNYQIVEEMN